MITNRAGAWLWGAGEAPTRFLSETGYDFEVSGTGTRVFYRALGPPEPGGGGLRGFRVSIYLVESGETVEVATVLPCQCDVGYRPAWSASERYLLFWDFRGSRREPGYVFDELTASIAAAPGFAYWHSSRDAYFVARGEEVYTHDIATGFDDRILSIVRVGEPDYFSGVPTFLAGGLAVFRGGTGPSDGYGTEIALVDVATGTQLGRWKLRQTSSFAFRRVPPVTVTGNTVVLLRPSQPDCDGMLILDLAALVPERCIPASAANLSPDGASLAVIRGYGCAFRLADQKPITAAIVSIAAGLEHELPLGTAGAGRWPLVAEWSEDGRYVIVTSGFCGI